VAKEIAAQQGSAITFMAKYDEGEGNSCQLKLSLRHTDGSELFSADDPLTPNYQQFAAGVLSTMRDFALLYAPNVNSYKRLGGGPLAPIMIGWSRNNRSCAIRLVGRGANARVENRVPGGDVNPYLALAATVAGGRYGIEHNLELEPEITSGVSPWNQPSLPRTIQEARTVFAESPIAREAFGDAVVAHYTTMADVELAAFGATVTDWELRRGFERM
jgi:glutamine synthetase